MMGTPWIADRRLREALARNEAFWTGELEETPLLWVTAPGATPGTPPTPPPTDEQQWTDVDYLMEKAEDSLSRTHYAGDALPVYNPWLGPDQFSAWLGADLTFRTKDNTSWVAPFIEDWAEHPDFRIDAGNRWWKKYLEILRASTAAGKGKWVTGYPDLHTGIDALGAMRNPERLMIDLLTIPDTIKRAMEQMTRLWKEVVDEVSAIVLPAGQGTTNWTCGWSAKRFVCVGQNDFTCLIGPAMFDEFCLADNVACCSHVDWTMYHLDGPTALQHVPHLLGIERLHCIQWIQGAGKPLPSEWTGLLKQIQAGGKSVQLMYSGIRGGGVIGKEIDALCRELDPTRLFIVAEVDSVETADFVVRRARETCAEARRRPR
jgi:5-methyltetrahydrofolate--homocysteine methyltransferase